MTIQAKFGCSTFIMFRRWGERPNERVIIVGIGWILLASATSGFSGYSEGPGFDPQLGPVFFLFFFWGGGGGISLLSQKAYHLLKSLQCMNTL